MDIDPEAQRLQRQLGDIARSQHAAQRNRAKLLYIIAAVLVLVIAAVVVAVFVL